MVELPMRLTYRVKPLILIELHDYPNESFSLFAAWCTEEARPLLQAWTCAPTALYESGSRNAKPAGASA
jgi:hypothetical protein